MSCTAGRGGSRRLCRNLTPGPSPAERGATAAQNFDKGDKRRKRQAPLSAGEGPGVRFLHRARILATMETSQPPPFISPGHEEVAHYVFTTDSPAWQKCLKDYARQNRRQPTPAEARLWQALRNASLGARFRRQHAIGAYIVDFICISAWLTIELDGEIHLTPEQAEYDIGRTFALTELGYRELRFTNQQVLHQLHQVLSSITEYLQNTPPTMQSSGSPSSLVRVSGAVLGRGEVPRIPCPIPLLPPLPTCCPPPARP